MEDEKKWRADLVLIVKRRLHDRTINLANAFSILQKLPDDLMWLNAAL